jgi:F-type H+-transporting ATPase subunit delta
MSRGRVAHRYAEALLLSAVEDKKEDEVAADVESVKRSIMASRELSLLLNSPIIKSDVKKRALRAIFEGKVGGLMLEFLSIVTEKGRESLVPLIVDRFDQLRNERLGIVTIEVSAANDLSRQQTSSLRTRFEAITRKTVTISFSVNKALKGGFLARVGDTVFDGSVRRQLERLRLRFLEGNGTN